MHHRGNRASITTCNGTKRARRLPLRSAADDSFPNSSHVGWRDNPAVGPDFESGMQNVWGWEGRRGSTLLLPEDMNGSSFTPRT